MTRKRIFVAGHSGMVGSALLRRLEADDVELVTRTRAELDLCDQTAVDKFFAQQKIDQVYLAAATVGGIQANQQYPADFLLNNLLIECNVIGSAHRHGVPQLLFLGSSCIYPKLAPQPIHEAALLTGSLELSNEPYAIAKIAGIKLCESINRQHGADYRSAMPTNLYGINDNFHPQNSHVVPALMRRFHEAKLAGKKQVEIWGSGRPLREFLYVDDLADACVFLTGLPASTIAEATEERCSHINIGTGEDLTIAALAEMMAQTVGYQGGVVFDTSMPDGTPRKLLDVGKLSSLGWQASTALQEGLDQTYAWFLEHESKLRGSAS